MCLVQKPLQQCRARPAVSGLCLLCAAQALQHWKDQFRGLYNSFEAERPVTSSFLGTASRSIFTAQPFESANTAANAHEFECAVRHTSYHQSSVSAPCPMMLRIIKHVHTHTVTLVATMIELQYAPRLTVNVREVAMSL